MHGAPILVRDHFLLYFKERVFLVDNRAAGVAWELSVVVVFVKATVVNTGGLVARKPTFEPVSMSISLSWNARAIRPVVVLPL